MVEIKGVAHFSIPVSDIAKSTKFYTEIVGMKYLSAPPHGNMVFLDAGGVCIILVKRDAPINHRAEDHDGVHHSFMVDSDKYQSALEHLRANGVDVPFQEDRDGGVVNGPRAYFRDPDGTVLEYIDRTSYVTSKP